VQFCFCTHTANRVCAGKTAQALRVKLPETVLARADEVNRMNRRGFIAGLGSSAAWPMVARAEQAAVPVIGYLSAESFDAEASASAGFRKGLSETGYVEGQNVTIEFRRAEGHADRLPALAADLVRRRVNVIAALANVAAVAAREATTSIPIVFTIGGDPVKIGLVGSLNRPSGNITGVSFLSSAVMAKMLEVLHAVVPNIAVIAALVNPDNPQSEADMRDAQDAARVLGMQLRVVTARTEGDINTAFEILVHHNARGLLIEGDPFFGTAAMKQLVTLTMRHAIPAIYQGRELPGAGGLMSYGASRTEALRLAGVYAGRILKGEKPADLPVQQATKVELVINLKTAKSLGLTIPPSLLARADEVFE
jgi:putative ABC transport system substrate-binding protein